MFEIFGNIWLAHERLTKAGINCRMVSKRYITLHDETQTNEAREIIEDLFINNLIDDYIIH